MRILMLPKDFPAEATPSAGVFVLRQAQALAELGHAVHVLRVVPAAPGISEKWKTYNAIPDEYVFEGISVKTIRAVFPPRMIGMEYLPLQVGAKIAREARTFGADVVHAHFLLPCGQLAVRQPFPSVVTAHGSDAYSWAWRRRGLTAAAREAVNGAGAVVAVSGFIRDKVLQLAQRDVSVVFNGADERVFYPGDRAKARNELGLPSGRPVIAFAGSLVATKGLFDLLEALALLADLQPVAVLAGEGAGRKAAQEFAAAHSLDVRFAGRLSHDELATVYAASDVFTLPSHNEGLPVVVCEAMLSGRAVVATPVGGIPEIVSDGRTGLLVPVSSPERLASALRRILEDSPLRERMETEAYAFAKTSLTWRVNALAHDRLYRSLTNGTA